MARKKTIKKLDTSSLTVLNKADRAQKRNNSDGLLKEVIGDLKKIFKEDHSVTMNINEPLPHIPSGSIIIDQLIGGRKNIFGFAPCPGYPRSRIINLYGEPSTGKTTLALEACAVVCAMGGRALYIDWEHEIAQTYARSLGCPLDDPDQMVIYAPDTLEQGISAACIAADRGVDLIVIDSVGAGMPDALHKQGANEIGKEIRMGLVASIWGKYLPKLKTIIASSGTAVIGISQLRATMNAGHGPKKQAQGGNAWRYYSALQIGLSKVKSEKTKVRNVVTRALEDQVSYARIRAKLDKCKVSDAQQQTLDFFIRWGSGIDNMASVLEVCSNYGLIKKATGSRYTYVAPDGTELKAHGFDKMLDVLSEHPEIYTDLYHKAVLFLREATPKALDLEDVEPEEEVSDNLDDLLVGMSKKKGKKGKGKSSQDDDSSDEDSSDDSSDDPEEFIPGDEENYE